MLAINKTEKVLKGELFLTDSNIFESLNNVDLTDKVKSKNNLTYLPWSSAWSEVKKRYPNANFKIIPQVIDEIGNTRPWHDDGKTGWVEVGVTIDEKEIIETLAIMDFRNSAIPADKITSVDANKSIKRCLVKACAMHGLGLYIYEGEELPEETSKILDLQDEVKDLISKKCALSDTAKNKVAEICKTAEKEANPTLDNSAITGNPKNIEDVDILTNLKRQLLAVRK